jgi:hypothetical protein
MTALMRHFRAVLSDESAARSVSQEAREIVRRAEVTVERYKTDNAARQERSLPIPKQQTERKLAAT